MLTIVTGNNCHQYNQHDSHGNIDCWNRTPLPFQKLGCATACKPLNLASKNSVGQQVTIIRNWDEIQKSEIRKSEIRINQKKSKNKICNQSNICKLVLSNLQTLAFQKVLLHRQVQLNKLNKSPCLRRGIEGCCYFKFKTRSK